MRGWRLLWAWVVVAAVCLAPAGPAWAGPADPVERALQAWDLAKAHAKLASISDPAARAYATGLVALYEGRYADAEAALAQASAAGGAVGAAAAEYLALARGAQRAFAGGQSLRAPDGSVELRLADSRDALLAPYLFDALIAARANIGPILGVVPDGPVRVEILDDPAKLAMVTHLPLDNIRTTGTVGITKHHRIVMVTPRVMLRGYPWLDTLVHEYVHYLLTLRTRNRAPVWLQEGLAKLLETRWRRSTPEPLDEPVAALLHRALQRDDLVTFQEVHPSVALLPSQERAALAYGQLESMLGFLLNARGQARLGDLLDAVADGTAPEDALAQVWGAPFADFMAAWRAHATKVTRRAKDGKLRKNVFLDGAPPPDVETELMGDVFSHMGGGKARQHARIGQLLERREHLRAAAIEYEKARAADRAARRDPALARRLGRVYFELGEFSRAAPLLQLASDRAPDDPTLAARLAEALRRTGDESGARAAADRALRENPFIPWLHCTLAKLARDPVRRAHEQGHCSP